MNPFNNNNEKEDAAKMDSLIRWTQFNTITPIEIVGWTDKTGSETFNMALSLSRARSIERYLVQNGASVKRISIQGRGVDGNTTSNAKARRVDVRSVIGLMVEVDPLPLVDTISTFEIEQFVTDEPEK